MMWNKEAVTHLISLQTKTLACGTFHRWDILNNNTILLLIMLCQRNIVRVNVARPQAEDELLPQSTLASAALWTKNEANTVYKRTHSLTWTWPLSITSDIPFRWKCISSSAPIQFLSWCKQESGCIWNLNEFMAAHRCMPQNNTIGLNRDNIIFIVSTEAALFIVHSLTHLSCHDNILSQCGFSTTVKCFWS